MARSKIVVGAGLSVFVNGKIYGQVTSFKWDSSTPVKANYGIDSLMPYELANTATKVVGSMSLVRVHGDGGLEGRGVVAPLTHLELEKYFSVLVVDRLTGLDVFRADHCKVTAQSWQVAARGKMEGSFSFEGIQWTNEADYA